MFSLLSYLHNCLHSHSSHAFFPVFAFLFSFFLSCKHCCNFLPATLVSHCVHIQHLPPCLLSLVVPLMLAVFQVASLHSLLIFPILLACFLSLSVINILTNYLLVSLSTLYPAFLQSPCVHLCLLCSLLSLCLPAAFLSIMILNSFVSCFLVFKPCYLLAVLLLTLLPSYSFTHCCNFLACISAFPVTNNLAIRFLVVFLLYKKAFVEFTCLLSCFLLPFFLPSSLANILQSYLLGFLHVLVCFLACKYPFSLLAYLLVFWLTHLVEIVLIAFLPAYLSEFLFIVSYFLFLQLWTFLQFACKFPTFSLTFLLFIGLLPCLSTSSLSSILVGCCL